MRNIIPNPIVGHFCAVVSAALAFVSIKIFVVMMFFGGLSAVYPISERIFQAGVTGVILFLIVAFVTFFATIIPVVLVHKVAERFSIRNLWFYIVCGGLTGFVLSPVGPAITPGWYTDPPEIPSLFLQAMSVSVFSVPSGAVGGWVYWLVTGRFVSTVSTGQKLIN